MYDSLLYGYGLSLEALSSISDLKLPYYTDKYLYFNDFLKKFINSEKHSRIYRDFLKLLDYTDQSIYETHKKVKNDFLQNYDDIKNMGFERWVSKYIFDDVISPEVKLTTYILYNFWFNYLHNEILRDPKSKEIIKNISFKLKKVLNDNHKIYTTNFDTIFDSSFEVNHLHGTFVLPLKKATQLVLKSYSNKTFEYPFLFGTSGYEKLNRLKRIRNINTDSYSLDFFYNSKLKLGNLLIIGISFSSSEIINGDLKRKYEICEKSNLLKSVDGHILFKLSLLLREDRLKTITYAYHSERDKMNLEQKIDNTVLENKIKFIHSSEILS